MSDFLSKMLPSEAQPPLLTAPRHQIIYTDGKTGKTTLAAAVTKLYEGFNIDLENGSNGVGGYPVNIVEKARQLGMKNVQCFKQLCREFQQAPQGPPDFLFFDKMDAMRDWAERWATAEYKNSVLGNNFQESTILLLPKFLGYMYLREKFLDLFNHAVASAKHVILFVSMREKYSAGGKDEKTDIVTANEDINLTGTLRESVVSFADATGYMYRGKDGANYISYRTRDQGAYAGCRIRSLEGKTVKVSWYDETGNLQIDWKAIYPEAQTREEKKTAPVKPDGK